MSADLEAFFADPMLSQLIERVRVSDDFLEVVDLSENQHSDMLAWCLNPSEGHLQGDAVIKDFLLAAHEAGHSGSEKPSRFLNRKFFDKWPPSRIRTSSFSTAFAKREESLGQNRLDLFLIDLDNKIVVVIENKRTAKLKSGQLDDYYKLVCANVKTGFFHSFDFLFVAVADELADLDDDKHAALSNKWAFIDYEWLKGAANRAQQHLERNNEGARLIMTYCRRQTEWATPHDEAANDLAASIAVRHEPALKILNQRMKARATKLTRKELGGEYSRLYRFIFQQRSVCERLVLARGIGTVAINFEKWLKTLKSSFTLNQGRTWLEFATRPMEEQSATPNEWPVFIQVYRQPTQAETESSKFTIRLIWKSEHAGRAARAARLRDHLAATYPKLKHHSNVATRRVKLSTDLDSDATVKRLQVEVETIHKSLSNFAG